MRPVRSLLPLIIGALAATACGKGAGATNAAQATIEFIRKNGFPKLSTLMPALPPQLARIPGVATGGTGLPELPRAVSGADFDHLTALLAEAQGLAAQGFSESRRLEGSLQNLVAPAYDLLGRADLFTPGEPGAGSRTEDSSSSPRDGGAALLADSGGGGVQSLFEDLLSQVRYAVDTGGKNGLPQYLVLGTDAKLGTVDISGVWHEGDAFATGFAAKVRLNSLDDFYVSITFAPGKLSGLLADWSAAKCGDDVWQLAVGAEPAGERTLSVTARECAASRDAVSQLALARGAGDAAGAWKLTGAFAQNFDGADPDTLRGFLGRRQGFVMQAAAASDASRLAAAAAVLGEADFHAPTQDKIDRFGVGALLARYFQAKYFDPKAKAAANGSAFDQYDNVAYWMCEAPVVAAAVQAEVGNTRELCASTALDVETILAALRALQKKVRSVGIVPQAVDDEISGVLGVLAIRNTLFVGGGGELAYKNAPDQTFASLDDARKTALPGSVGDAAWLGGAQAALPRLTQAEIPDTAYKALQSGLGGFVKAQCKALASDAQKKAGKADTAAAACGG